MSTVLAAGLLAVAIGLLLAPGRSRDWRAPPLRARRLDLPRKRRSRPPRLDLGAVVTEVATRLHAGAPVERAWAESLARAGVEASEEDMPGAEGGWRLAGPEEGAPRELVELAAHGGRRGRWRRGGLDPITAGALPGALAACRLSRELGAPLADVLERCAAGLTEAGQAEAARTVALAGPRATARLLGWLPLLGLLLGFGVGVDPAAVLLGGGAGSACLVAGLVLVAVGRRWVRTLEHAAGAQDAPGAAGRRRWPS